MISIITGSVNSGKTSMLIDIFRKLGKGDGFFNRKIYIDAHYVGQEVVRMQNGESKMWSTRIYQNDNWNEVFKYEKYSFSRNGLEFAESIIESIINSSINPIYIDEIGPLELQGMGFDKLFKKCLGTKKEIYVVIRNTCVNSVIERYNIKMHKIIEAKPPSKIQ
ncbi:MULTISPECIES: nucleoside-triphosphatase [unclassified Clostridium]|uniref:nucleoside-triphosphatase n=1 Tax=unclassified Clostridium TaxID=2614128 RepID=UPI0002972B90|nr:MULTISPECIES: nucleoside-triphosphatase [unclassified Clostridium]EKQ52837.1 MAG: putative nucleotide kinase [Clostridium sp. Maddingley MBC34-26]